MNFLKNGMKIYSIKSAYLIVFPIWCLVTWSLDTFACVQLLGMPWTAAHQNPLFFTITCILLKFMSIESAMLSDHLFLCWPLPLLPSIFLAWRSCPVSWLFVSDGLSIGASTSASILPINIQSWFPLGLTALITMKFKGSQESFSITTIQKH